MEYQKGLLFISLQYTIGSALSHYNNYFSETYAMIERTMYFLKPGPVCNHARTIYDEVLALGLEIPKWHVRPLTEADLRVIYPDLSSKLWQATATHLLGRDVTFVFVTGEDAVNRLANYAGRNVNPKKCTSGTVRFRYGSRKPVALGDGVLYYRNAIHCPKNGEEAQRDVALFFRD